MEGVRFCWAAEIHAHLVVIMEYARAPLSNTGIKYQLDIKLDM